MVRENFEMKGSCSEIIFEIKSRVDAVVPVRGLDIEIISYD